MMIQSDELHHFFKMVETTNQIDNLISPVQDVDPYGMYPVVTSSVTSTASSYHLVI